MNFLLATGRASRLRLALRLSCCLATMLLAVLAASCGGDSDDGDDSASTSATATACGDEPIKVMTIWSLTGQIGVWGDDVPNSAKAAQDAINADCSLGRPLEVTVCDDQSTANGSLRCGVKARDEGYLALIGFSSGPAASSGPQAARLPAVFIQDDGSAWNHTNKLSYPAQSAGLSVVGDVKTAAALGDTSYTFVGIDVPSGRGGAQLGSQIAETMGIEFSQKFVPATTTDFTSVAAQLWASKPDGFNLSLPGTQPFIKALQSVGADLDQMKYIGTMGLLTPTQRAGLGSDFSGYEAGATVPTSESSNEGIAQMKEEFEAAGLSFSDKISDKGVQEWTAVHALETALAPLAKNGEIDSLDSDSLVDAVVSHGEYNLPTIAPFNFQQEAEFSDPALSKTFAGTRTFTNQIGVFRFEKDGTEKQLGGWQDLNGEFSLESGGG